MGTIKTTNIETITGSGTLTLGTSGETITIPSGVTLTNNGTATGFGESNTPYFKAYLNPSVSISQNTNVTVVFNNTSFDSASGFNTSTGKYTIPSGQGGKWYFETNLRFNDASLDNETAVYFFINASESSFSNRTVGGNYPTVQHSAILDVSAGDEISVKVYATQANPDLNGAAVERITTFNGFRITS